MTTLFAHAFQSAGFGGQEAIRIFAVLQKLFDLSRVIIHEAGEFMNNLAIVSIGQCRLNLGLVHILIFFRQCVRHAPPFPEIDKRKRSPENFW